MANISAIKLPNGTTYTIVDNTSGYTKNTGTVTSVAASGSGGISISGSPITTSGTIAIGLNLSTAINGLGEGTSPAQRADYIVAQYAGGGTTTTTYHRRSLANIFAALNASDITTALGYTPYNATNPNGYTTNTGTVTSVGTGVGLTGGSITTSGTIKANLTSDTALTNAALSVTEDANRIYPVRIDKNSKLVVVVPWTNVNSSYLTSSSTLNAAKLSGAIPSAVTATTQTAGDNSTKIATTAFVSSAISGLPTPMQFIGTVGTNGTTTWANLPAASGHNGYTYKVITAHTAETGKPAADVGDALISNGTEWVVIPAGDETATQNATTGISIANHGTGTVIGVQSSTTTASKVTVGSHSTDYGVKSAGSASTWAFTEVTIPNVTSAGTASSWTFESKSIPNVTAVGSGSASLTFAMDTTDTKKLKITFSHTHTAPTLGTAISIQSKSGGSNGTAPTLGTAIKVQSKSSGANSTAPTLGSKVPTVSASDVTVPIKNSSASTFVTGTTHTITDNGHTHSI